MRLAAIAAAAVALAGCGGSPGDLMALSVSGGSGRVAHTLVVSADGLISCDRHAEHSLASGDVLDARSIVREAKSFATRAATYPGGGRRFELRDQDGSVSWGETSAALPPVLPRAELFALRVGPAACGTRL